MQADPGLEHFAEEYGKLLRTVKQLHGEPLRRETKLQSGLPSIHACFGSEGL